MKSQIVTIINTVKDAKDHVASFGEVVIDLFVDNEFFANIPLVEYAVKILNIRDTYRLNKAKRNYSSFINSVSMLNCSEIERLSAVLFNGGELSEDASEVLFEIIIEGEKPIKTSVAGKLVCALAKDEINLDMYYDLLLIVHSGSIIALKSIPKAATSMEAFGEWTHFFGIPEEPLLISLGIVKKQGTFLNLSKLGKQLFIRGYDIK